MVDTKDLSSLRKKLGLTQQELAEKLKVSRNTISRWERGNFRPSAESMAALELLEAELEEKAAPDALAPEALPPTKPKGRWWVLVCMGLACTLLLGITALIRVHSLKQQMEPENAVPEEQVEWEEVDESVIIVQGTLHP